ncbi:MAG: hypothetical protein PVH16_06065 [Thioalkalispiraceae bacterium]
MEEDQYRQTYRTFNQRRCVYEKAINSRRCTCQSAHRFNLADREGVACQSAAGHERCHALLQLMRKNAGFALKLADADGSPLPHAKEIKVQVGGLLGLQGLLRQEKRHSESVENIDHILQQALREYGSFNAIPFSEVVKSITTFKGRQRRSGKRQD